MVEVEVAEVVLGAVAVRRVVGMILKVLHVCMVLVVVAWMAQSADALPAAKALAAASRVAASRALRSTCCEVDGTEESWELCFLCCGCPFGWAGAGAAGWSSSACGFARGTEALAAEALLAAAAAASRACSAAAFAAATICAMFTVVPTGAVPRDAVVVVVAVVLAGTFTTTEDLYGLSLLSALKASLALGGVVPGVVVVGAAAATTASRAASFAVDAALRAA